MQWQKMLVIDLECSCFREDDIDKPAGWLAAKDQEIIEIGAAVVHLPNREILDVRSFLVRPDGPMGTFCKELTSLTTADVADEPQLIEAIADMRVWCKKQKFDLGQMPWASWGDYDRVQLFRECARKGIKYPFGRAHFNIKGLFSMLLGRKTGYGLSAAMGIIGLEFDGRPHRGVDDARNIAKTILQVLRTARCG